MNLYNSNDNVVPMIWESGGPNPSPGYSERMGMYNPGGGVPHARFGGTTSVVGGMPSGAMNYQPQYNSLVNTDSPLDMEVSMNISPQNELVVQTDVEVTGNITTTNNEVTFIVTLEADADWFCVVIAYDHSTPFDLTTIGQTETYQHAFPLDPSWDITKLRGIALVQSYAANYQILQAGTTMFSGLLPLFTTNVSEGPAYLGVQFNSNSLPQSGIESWEWDFDGDGTFDSTEENPFHMYTVQGSYDVTLRIGMDGEYAELTVPDCITVTDGSSISGLLSGSWLADFNPYVIADNTEIAVDNQLVILPGVELQFANGTQLTVEGELIADASAGDPIVMSSADEWAGIRFVGTQANNSIVNCEISKASESAISVESDSYVDIVGNKIYENTSTSLGAAIDIASSNNVNISQNYIANNSSTNLVGGIGAIASAVNIWNNVFVNNTGAYGALSLKNDSDAMVTNNTFANNLSTSGDPYLIFLFNAIPTFTNNIIIDNNDIFFAPFGDPVVTYSCISGGFTGEGNIDEDPLFMAPSEGDGIDYDGLAANWTLQTGSPCIDAGDPDAMYNDPDGTRNDMGAYGGPDALSAPVSSDPNGIPIITQSSFSVYPNPFNPQTKISLNIADKDKNLPVSVKIYNLKGQLVKTLVENEVISFSNFVWNGSDNSGDRTSTGMYFIMLDTASVSVSTKVLLLK